MEPNSPANETFEPILDPGRPIIDAHFHFVRQPAFVYEVDEYRRDTSSGHNIVKSLFIECSQDFDNKLPLHLKSVAETKYAAHLATLARQQPGVNVAGIVARVDLRLGEAMEEVLNAHLTAAGSLLKGIRQIAIRDPHVDAISIPEMYFAPKDLYEQPEFRNGLRRLGKMGLSFDAWHYHHQLQTFIELARSVPDTLLVLDHFATPLGVGPYRNQRKEIFDRWRKDMTELARCPNVFAKLGGLAMRDNGFGWEEALAYPTSDVFVSSQAPYYHHTIECFSPERCMFESNFPVDKASVPYYVLFNAFKKIADSYSSNERHAMFYRTADSAYRLS